MGEGSSGMPDADKQPTVTPRDLETAQAEAARAANALAVARDILRAAERARAEAEKEAEDAARAAREARRASDEARRAREAVVYSTSWRLTAPLRTAGGRHPRIALMVSRTVKVIWWTITLQLRHRYAMWRRNRRSLPAAAVIDGPRPAVASARVAGPAQVSDGSTKQTVRAVQGVRPRTQTGAAARRREGRLNVLYFSPFPSHPASHGNSATIQQFALRFQEMGHRIHFALLQSDLFGTLDLIDMHAAWDTVDVIPNSIPIWANGSPISFDGWYEDGLGQRIRDLCDQYDIDVVFCSYVFQSKLLDYVPSHMLKVIDTHDKMGDRYDMLREHGLSPEFFSCTPEEEGRYLRRADLVVARRQEEADYFNNVTGLHTAVVVPYFEAPKFLEKSSRELLQVGIVASRNQLNLAMVRNCLETIARRLAGAECPFTVNVAGEIKELVDASPAGAHAVFRAPWVDMRGFVPDIDGFYAEMDLIVSPVTVGTGINVKTVQAMAHGKPLLSTTRGSAGIDTEAPEHRHADLDSLVESLFALAEQPLELQRLAALSREQYLRFHDESVDRIAALFTHPKLRHVAPVRLPHLMGSTDGETADRGEQTGKSKQPTEDYQEWTRSVFGEPIPVPGVILASSFDPGGEWGAKMHNAMIDVECKYVESLLTEIRDRNIRGDLVEFGIYKGWWIKFLYECSEAIGLTDRAVIGYDSFQGLSEPSAAHDTTYWKRGMYAAARKEVEEFVQARSRPRIRLVEGWFADSLGGSEARQVRQIAYARIDCDIYEPAVQCLDYLSNRLSDGAILVFDDWPHRMDVGEGLAFAQWVNTVPWLRFEFLFYGTWGHLYLRVHKKIGAV
jgi:Macrocin-O-methyltransferase (TylF)/Glycosyl transferases group 1